jgi:hypothetical protein
VESRRASLRADEVDRGAYEPACTLAMPAPNPEECAPGMIVRLREQIEERLKELAGEADRLREALVALEDFAVAQSDLLAGRGGADALRAAPPLVGGRRSRSCPRRPVDC